MSLSRFAGCRADLLLWQRLQHGAWYFLVLCILCMSSLLAGCEKDSKITPNESSSASVRHGVPKRIALVMKTMSNPFFVEMEKGARQAEKELGIRLIVRAAASETSIEQQILIIDELILDKVDAIVVAPGDSQRLVPVLKKAQMAGIKLVNIDNLLNAEAMSKARMQPIPIINSDNEKASFEAVNFIAQQVKQPAKAAILEGLRSAENASQRLRGAQRAFAAYPQIKIVASESANWKIDEAYQVTARIFAKQPDITLLFCANDMMAMGALKYLHDKNINGVLIASYDALEDVRNAIKEGKVAVTVDQQAAQQGYQGIMVAHKLALGETVPLQIQVDARLIHAASLH